MPVCFHYPTAAANQPQSAEPGGGAARAGMWLVQQQDGGFESDENLTDVCGL